MIMEKKIKIGLTILFIGMCLLEGWLILSKPECTTHPPENIQPTNNCSVWEQQIRDKIEKANYCSIDSDCMSIKLNDGCLGCFIVNKNEVEDIRKEAKEFGENCNKMCLIDCIHEEFVGLKCINGKCPWPLK